MVEIEYKEKRR